MHANTSHSDEDELGCGRFSMILCIECSTASNSRKRSLITQCANTTPIDAVDHFLVHLAYSSVKPTSKTDSPYVVEIANLICMCLHLPCRLFYRHIMIWRLSSLTKASPTLPINKRNCQVLHAPHGLLCTVDGWGLPSLFQERRGWSTPPRSKIAGAGIGSG